MRWIILIVCAGLVALPADLACLRLEKESPTYGVIKENGPLHALSKPWIPNPDLVAKKEGNDIAIRVADDEMSDGNSDLPEYFGAFFGSGAAITVLLVTSLITSMGMPGYYINLRYWPGLIAIGIILGFLCTWSDRIRLERARAPIKPELATQEKAPKTSRDD